MTDAVEQQLDRHAGPKHDRLAGIVGKPLAKITQARERGCDDVVPSKALLGVTKRELTTVIISVDQRRALDFIHASTAGGYRPTEVQLEEWRLRPEPKPGKQGELLQPKVVERLRPATGIYAMTNVQGQLQKAIGTWAQAIPSLGDPGTRVTPAVYGPPGPPEKFTDHLLRLNWIDRDSRGGLGLTPLSRALMRSAHSIDEGEVAAVVLNPNDPLAYSKLIGRIAGRNGELVVDPYLRAADLFGLLDATDVRRFLVGKQLGKTDIAEVQTLVSRWPGSGVELRIAECGILHDRYVLSDTGVMMTGGSMNGVGRTLNTVVVDLPDEAALAVRNSVEAWWDTAEVLAVSPDEVEMADLAEQTGADLSS